MTPQEEFIIKAMRELRPFEQIVITKDQGGRPNTYLIHRQQKVIISDAGLTFVK